MPHCVASERKKCGVRSASNSPMRTPASCRSWAKYGRPGEVQRDHGERLVHGQQERAVAADPALLAERLAQRLAEGQPDVLDGVVPVDVEVAAGADGEVEPAVVREQHEHVVEEPDAGDDVGDAVAVEVQRQGDVGLACAGDLRAVVRWTSGAPLDSCLRR